MRRIRRRRRKLQEKNYMMKDKETGKDKKEGIGRV